jgi:hypothetical protein
MHRNNRTAYLPVVCFGLALAACGGIAARDGGGGGGPGDAAVGNWTAGPGLFTATGSMHAARGEHTATLLPDGKVLIAGGYDEPTTCLPGAELYDPATGAFTVTGSLANARASHTATLLPDGKVLVTGGISFGPFGGPPYLASAELYDPSTGAFAPTGSMATPRSGHTATLLHDGRVLVVGGDASIVTDGGPGGYVYLASAELYDPSSGTFVPSGSLATGRAAHTATSLADGQVLVAGGLNAAVAVTHAELYNPATGTFGVIGETWPTRSGHTATLLGDGRVLLVGGGDSPEAAASAALYDPATGSLTNAEPIRVLVGDGHTATLLPNGKVLIAGGREASSSAELFDPVGGAFKAVGAMTTARAFHTATLLPDGKVLLAGANNYNGASFPGIATAEIYY